ncbi:MAG: membrane protein insertion efficiency factor YidD [Campylobacterales bacterium]|nr:membrane protein insertion efficiency factor YidD [Campylobacterales bacterium]
MLKQIFILPIKIYQKFSRLTPPSCRYYPTCSEYAKMQFEHNTPLVALLNATLRILRCNQIFKGGFNYPTTRFFPQKFSLIQRELNNKYGTIKVKYWLVPKNKNNYYIIKDISAPNT